MPVLGAATLMETASAPEMRVTAKRIAEERIVRVMRSCWELCD
jgi:hypothetical protein